jgi:hypothetical protein
MSRLLPISPSLRLLSAAALALAVQGVLPQRVAASCGDWLAGHAAESAASDAEIGSLDQHPISTQTPAVPFDAPRPCQGPGCRRAPDAPPPPVPPTLAESQDRWLTLTAEPVNVSARAVRLVLDEMLELTAGLLPRVERPPRV